MSAAAREAGGVRGGSDLCVAFALRLRLSVAALLAKASLYHRWGLFSGLEMEFDDRSSWGRFILYGACDGTLSGEGTKYSRTFAGKLKYLFIFVRISFIRSGRNATLLCKRTCMCVFACRCEYKQYIPCICVDVHILLLYCIDINNIQKRTRTYL